MGNLDKLKEIVGMVGKDPYAGMSDQEKKLARIQSIFKVVDEGVTKEDFTKKFEQVLKIVVEMQKRNEKEISLLSQAHSTVLDALQKKHDSSLSELKGQVDGVFVGNRISQLEADHQKRMAMLEEKMSQIVNGTDGLDGLAGKDGVDGKDGLDGSPDTPEQVRNKLEKLRGDDRIDAGAIKNIEKFIKSAGGATRGFLLRVGGTKRGMINEVNFTGSGVAYSSVNGLPTVTITGGTGASGAGNAYAWFVF